MKKSSSFPRKRESRLFWIPVFTGMTMLCQNAYACSVCFGDPNSLQSKAVGVSVLFLLAVIMGVLAAIGYTIFACVQRAKKLSQDSSAFPSA